VLESVKTQGSIRFGEDFELDLRTYELRRSDRVLKLERIPMELLLLLVEQRGQLVARDQIVERIWGKGVCLDTDNSINGAVRKIRQVLKDDPEHPRFVQTVTGRGYRFIAPLMERETEEGPVVPPPRPASESPKNQPDRRWMAVLGLAVAVIAVVGVYLGWLHLRPPSQPSARRPMLAVLPFENLTGDARQDYFSDGLTEEMISQLGRLNPERLGVIARTSVMHYKNSQSSLDQIGRELGVQYILEGSVRRDSDKVRITAQLIQMKDQTHLWTRQYDRELKGLLVVQGEIAEEIAEEIQSALGDQDLGNNKRDNNNDKRAAVLRQPALSPEALDAYDLYLKGQYFLNKRTSESLEKGIGYFQQAIDRDPTYARAYAGLADCYALITGYDPSVPAKQSLLKARAAAVKAVELDEGLAEAHTALAVVAQDYDWDWPTAEKEYRRAIELNPNYATAHHWYGEYLGLMGRFEEAFREFERARQLDPLSLIIATDHAVALLYSRQYDRAISQFREVLEMEPDFPRAHVLVVADVQKGLYADALADIEKWQRIDDSPWSWAMLVYVYGRSGQPMEARSALERLQQLNRRRHISAASISSAYMGMGDKDQAFAWLNQAIAEHSVDPSLRVNPFYDPLRGDPRFQELLRRVRLAQ
jgi:TolB-like protein/DNA-binding winged helix-turn-helix (wHTH) protein/Flp pilus assembly protein TadD